MNQNLQFASPKTPGTASSKPGRGKPLERSAKAHSGQPKREFRVSVRKRKGTGGRVTDAAGSEVFPTGIASLPKGIEGLPEGMAGVPAGSVIVPTGSASLPAGTATFPAGIASIPTGMVSGPAGIASLPAGKTTIPAGIASIPALKYRNKFRNSNLRSLAGSGPRLGERNGARPSSGAATFKLPSAQTVGSHRSSVRCSARDGSTMRAATSTGPDLRP